MALHFGEKNSELHEHRLIRCEFNDELNKKSFNCKKIKRIILLLKL